MPTSWMVPVWDSMTEVESVQMPRFSRLPAAPAPAVPLMMMGPDRVLTVPLPQ